MILKRQALNGLFVATLFAALGAAAADIDVGKVLAYDRQAQVLVLSDRSVWSLKETTASLPQGLAAGDEVQFSYESGERGVAKILEINVIREAPEPGVQNVATGNLVAFDRDAGLLVFEDGTAWSLNKLQASIPFGLMAGDRVSIEYLSDADGVTVINGIEIVVPN